MEVSVDAWVQDFFGAGGTFGADFEAFLLVAKEVTVGVGKLFASAPL